ncbi:MULTISPECIES: pseudouridine synthase [Prochlorococcus]|uniref:pseudouridine synthase n=1 Tax=Prochlorococcus TaxID=1218 RepID=UPI0026A4CDC6
MYPIGRLDYQSKGAILITNDGELTLRLTHPRYSHTKTYHAWVKGIPCNETIKSWAEGVILESKRTRTACLKVVKTMKHKHFLKSN